LNLSWRNRRGSTCRGSTSETRLRREQFSENLAELKNFLENELRRLENNETFVPDEFQKGVVRALIDLFRMVNGLASIAAQ